MIYIFFSSNNFCFCVFSKLTIYRDVVFISNLELFDGLFFVTDSGIRDKSESIKLLTRNPKDFESSLCDSITNLRGNKREL